MAARPTPPQGLPKALKNEFDERRRYPRFRPFARVELSGGGEVSSLPVADISAGGCRLEMEVGHLTRLEIDEEVTVFLSAEGMGGPVYAAVPASVVRIQRGEPSCVALEWGRCTPEVADRLTAILLMLEDATSTAPRK